MSAARGRPRADIDMATVEILLNRQWNLNAIAELFKVSPQTLKNHMNRAGISKRDHLEPAELLHLLEEVGEISGRGRATGHRMHRAQLMSRIGCRPTLEEVLRVLREHDPAANEARLERLLRRAVYDVVCAMSLWHMDTYDKLKLYGFYVHGIIDGGTKLIIAVTVAQNKSASAISYNYFRGVAAYGRPMRLRADMAYEARDAGADMIQHRGEDAYLVGPSTANQPIENWWNQAWRHVASYYRTLFADMERRHILDRGSASDLFSLGRAFMPVLQDDFTTLGNTWNHHTIRPQARYEIRSKVPINEFEASYAAFARDGFVDRDAVRDISSDVLWAGGAQPVPEGEVTSGGVREYAGRRGGPTVADSLRHAWERTLRDQLCGEVPGDAPEQRYMVHRQVSLELSKLRSYREGPVLGGWAAFLSSTHTPNVPATLINFIRSRLQALVTA